MDWIFVGDGHFALGDGDRRERFIRFIRINRPSLHTLVIMGDLFDFWFGFRELSPLQREYRDILDMLQRLRAEGVDVIYLEGNHDFRLGPYMTEELGIQVHGRSTEMYLDGKRVYLAHGDRAYPKLGHMIFSSFVRNWFTYRLMSWLGPQIAIGVARWLSADSRRRGLERPSGIIARVRKFALDKLSEGFDAVILAHTHVPEALAVERENGVGYYYNVGNWLRDFSYLRYNGEKGFSLEYFTAD